MKPKEKITTAEHILELAMSFQRSRILLSAFDLGVFTAIGAESLDSREIARRIDADARGTDRLLNALCAMRLLYKESFLFRNTPVSLKFLAETSDDYLSNLGHASNLYSSWAHMTASVRAGTASRSEEKDEFSLNAFISAMHRRARDSAHVLAQKLDLTGINLMLDVGGGSGVYSIAFARSKEDLHSVVMDTSPVTALARSYIAGAGLSDRISTMDGDYHTTEFGGPYDLVFFSAVIHINSMDENRALMRKAFNSLKEGGTIAVQDFIMDEDRVLPAQGAVFALNMLVNTGAGDTYTGAEVRGWLEEAGCADIRRIDTGPHTAMLTGKKPRG